MSVLLDTGVVFSFLNREDRRHAAADELVGRIARGEFGRPFVTDHVIDELFTLVRVRTHSPTLEESARRFLPLPTPALKGLTMLSLGEEALLSTWETFQRYRDQRLSFTDCGLIVALRRRRIDWLATFDEQLRHLAPTAGGSSGGGTAGF